jgi:hypothetical protein
VRTELTSIMSTLIRYGGIITIIPTTWEEDLSLRMAWAKVRGPIYIYIYIYIYLHHDKCYIT